MSKGDRSQDAQRAESGVRGRSSKSNTTGRFEKLRNERFDDGWEEAPDDRPNRVDTTLTAETAKVILSRNESPDIGFDRSINPYRGMERYDRACAIMERNPGQGADGECAPDYERQVHMRACLSPSGLRTRLGSTFLSDRHRHAGNLDLE